MPLKPKEPNTPDLPVSEGDQINQNIQAVVDFHAREDGKISRSQRILERFTAIIGTPLFLGFTLFFVALWMGLNDLLGTLGYQVLDPPPHFWLQGLVGLGALVTATSVLCKQNRFEKLAERRSHLDLKVTLLTEQKTAKLIDLLEELRRDLPNVKDRHDPEAAALQLAMDPDGVVAALDEGIRPVGGPPRSGSRPLEPKSTNRSTP